MTNEKMNLIEKELEYGLGISLKVASKIYRDEIEDCNINLKRFKGDRHFEEYYKNKRLYARIGLQRIEDIENHYQKLQQLIEDLKNDN